jgi:hypothetical protein
MDRRAPEMDGCALALRIPDSEKDLTLHSDGR